MKQLTCEVCGGNDLLKQDGVFVCQSCGCKYSVDEVKKLMVQISEPVKVEGIYSLEDELKSAKTLMNLHQYERAKEKYHSLCDKNPNNWECWWGLYNSSKISEKLSYDGYDYSLLPPVEKHYILALDFVPENLRDAIEKKHDADWREYYNSVFFSSYRDGSNEPEILITLRNEAIAKAELCNKVKNKIKLLGTLSNLKIEDVVKRYKYVEKFIEVREHSISFIAYYCGVGDDCATEHKECITFLKKIINLESVLSDFKDDGCYIATSIYGSYDCPQVWTLRRYRDYTLTQTWYGRAFIKTYYAISPTLVKWFGNTTWFRNFWKNRLDRMVNNLKNKGFEDKPYDDKNW